MDGLTHDQLRNQTNTFKKEIAEIRKPIFDKIEEAHIWLNYNCQYIPRKEIGVDNYE